MARTLRSAGADESQAEHNSVVDSATTVAVAEFVAGGDIQDEDVVEVGISFGIIDRFSQRLYSSPNKTFEELISNSYDAGAERVWVSLSDDLAAPDASITVIDDGDSMDLQGLRDLWLIGKSPKRRPDMLSAPARNRKPIGKFGIGKLATYVLATQLTFVCFKDGAYRAVTMDYGLVTGGISEPRKMRLVVAHISAGQARETLERVVPNQTALDALFGEAPSDS